MNPCRVHTDGSFQVAFVNMCVRYSGAVSGADLVDVLELDGTAPGSQRGVPVGVGPTSIVG